jgi:hypothetical protein
LKRSSFLAVTLLCVACATPGDGPAVAQSGLDISLNRASPTLPILVMTITNRSGSPICIQRDLLENPNTYYLELHLYDAVGGAVSQWEEGGYVPPPLEGVVRLGLGEVARARYNLDTRFRLAAGDTPLADGMSAQVSFAYGYCGHDWELRATSTRQAI